MNRSQLNYGSELTQHRIPEPIHRLLLAFLFTGILYFNVGSAFPSKPTLVNGAAKTTTTYSEPGATSFPSASNRGTLEGTTPLEVARNGTK
ncbi:MAG TPA: hypothetical protein IGS52_08585 [Oscillatoriaceae cyanobacterium M33_DOE_052]|uniref:Uncharacterized protein n=1 Tax=Planktothricoides sp. SpSt-374 TaxID=2282167 RepID=A0A7C3ZWP1_9CYAN|nr:hypothetical protein [Oscillatoriaceae cyanobacterium M33_DOE_052]